MQDFTKGDFILGVAPLKEEGSTIQYDRSSDNGVAIFSRSHPGNTMSTWPGETFRNQLERVVADLEACHAADVYFEISGDDAGELASVIRAALKQ